MTSKSKSLKNFVYKSNQYSKGELVLEAKRLGFLYLDRVKKSQLLELLNAKKKDQKKVYKEIRDKLNTSRKGYVSALKYVKKAPRKTNDIENIIQYYEKETPNKEDVPYEEDIEDILQHYGTGEGEVEDRIIYLINVILNAKPTKKEMQEYIKWNNIKGHSKLSNSELHQLLKEHIKKNHKVIIDKYKNTKKIKPSSKISTESQKKAYEDLKKLVKESQKEYIPLDIRLNPYQSELTEALEGLQKIQDEKYNIYKPKSRGKPNKPRKSKSIDEYNENQGLGGSDFLNKKNLVTHFDKVLKPVIENIVNELVGKIPIGGALIRPFASKLIIKFVRSIVKLVIEQINENSGGSWSDDFLDFIGDAMKYTVGLVPIVGDPLVSLIRPELKNIAHTLSPSYTYGSKTYVPPIVNNKPVIQPSSNPYITRR